MLSNRWSYVSVCDEVSLPLHIDLLELRSQVYTPKNTVNPLNIFVQTVFVEFCFHMCTCSITTGHGLTKDLACLGKDSASEFMVHTYYWLIHIGKAPLVKRDLPLVVRCKSTQQCSTVAFNIPSRC